MTTPYLKVLLLWHVAFLCFTSWRLSQKLIEAALPRIAVAALLFWMNAVHTSQLTSLAGKLGTPWAFLLTSMLVQGVYWMFFGWLSQGAAPAPSPWRLEEWREMWRGKMTVVLAAVVALVAFGALLIGISVLPNNWDTLAYRFPRALFYLSSGALRHAGPGLDPRLLTYPYNGSVLYLFLAQYELTGIWFNLVSLGAWLLSVLAAFLLPLQLGMTFRHALYGAALFATTPIVLCLATSTNDELLAGLPLAFAAMLLAHWLRTRHAGLFVLFVMAVAMSAGTKLHIVFLLPWLLLAGAIAAVVYRAELREILRDTFAGRAGAVAAGVALAIPLAGGFLVSNYAAMGKFTDPALANDVLNYPFHAGSARQTMYLYGMQMLLSPLPDHAYPMSRERRERMYTAMNEWAGPRLFDQVKQGPPYTHPYYRFRGLNPPDAVDHYEQSLWIGLIPWVLAGSFLWLLINAKILRCWEWLALLTYPAWFVVISSMLRYAETVGTYFAYPAVFAVIAVLLGLHAMEKRGAMAAKIAGGVAGVLLLSNVWLAGGVLTANAKRNVFHAFETSDGEGAATTTSPGVRSILAGAKQVYIEYTHWELLYWNLMRLNAAARYHTGPVPESIPLDLYLKPLGSRHAWGGPVPVRGKGVGIFKLAGNMASGEDLIFCSGPQCRNEDGGDMEYFTMPVRYDAGELAVSGAPHGLRAGTRAFARFVLFGASGSGSEASPWVPVAGLPSFRHRFTKPGMSHLQIEISCEAGPDCIHSRTVFPLAPGSRMLLDPVPTMSAEMDPASVERLFGPAWEGAEGSGYWKFRWTLVPGTRSMRAEYKGGRGEVVVDRLQIQSVSEQGFVLWREGVRGEYLGRWATGDRRAAQGGSSWDKQNIWEAHHANSPK